MNVTISSLLIILLYMHIFLLFQVSKIMNSRTQKAVIATVFIGADSSPMDDCHVRFVDELFRIEKNIKLDERNGDMERRIIEGSPVKRKFRCLRKEVR